MSIGDIHAPRKIRLIETDPPQLDAADGAQGRGQIIVQPEVACLCGSDLLHFEADYPEYAPEVGQSLHEIQPAFDLFAERRDGALKVFVEFPSYTG